MLSNKVGRPPKPFPLSGAERTRLWRVRKLQLISVTGDGNSSSPRFTCLHCGANTLICCGFKNIGQLGYL